MGIANRIFGGNKPGFAMPEWITALLQNASSVQGKRSSMLNPLGWLVALLIVATTSLSVAKASLWVLGIAGGGLALSIALYLCSFTYLLIKDRDGLRSEKYALEQMRIEKLSQTIHAEGIDPIEGLSQASTVRAVIDKGGSRD